MRLAYVLGNWRKHAGPPPPVIRFDEMPFPEDGLLPIRFPTSFLLREGWQKHGLISPWHRPGARHQPGTRQKR
jgi:hypothetical protein